MLAHVYREYNLNRIFLSWLGLWPFQNKFVRHSLQFCYLMIEICYNLIDVIMLYENWGNAQVTFEACYQCVMLGICIVKMVNEIWNYDKIRQLYQDIDDHWNMFTSEFEVQILKKYTHISRQFTIFYSILLYVMTTLFLSIPLIPIVLDNIRPLNESRPRKFPVVTELQGQQDKYYVALYCFQIGTIGLGTIGMVGIDTMYVAFTAHACSLFAIISRQFEEMTSRLNGDETISKHDHSVKCDVLKERFIYERYIVCLKQHQLALKFVENFNSAYQMVALFLLLLNGATISLVGVRVIYLLDQIKDAMRFIFIIIGMSIQLLVICYSGQKLIDMSQDIFYRAYAMEWHEFSPRLKSLLIITLHRSIVPCSLMAGKMIPLSIITYATVMRTAISYFMTFLSLK